MAAAGHHAACHARDPGHVRARPSAPAGAARLPAPRRRPLLRREKLPTVRSALASRAGPDADDPRRPGRRAARRCAQAPSLSISRCGAACPTGRPLRAHSAGVDRDGISSARRWRNAIWDCRSTFMAAEPTSSSRIMRRSWPRARRRGIGRSSGSGSTWTHAARRGEDVQVHRQHDLRARRAPPDAPGRSSAVPAGRALPPAVRPRRPTDGGRGPAGRALRRGGSTERHGSLEGSRARAPPFGCSTRTWTPLRCWVSCVS